jgi:hypothetical protein
MEAKKGRELRYVINRPSSVERFSFDLTHCYLPYCYQINTIIAILPRSRSVMSRDGVVSVEVLNEGTGQESKEETKNRSDTDWWSSLGLSVGRLHRCVTNPNPTL